MDVSGGGGRIVALPAAIAAAGEAARQAADGTREVRGQVSSDCSVAAAAGQPVAAGALSRMFAAWSQEFSWLGARCAQIGDAAVAAAADYQATDAAAMPAVPAGSSGG